MARRDYLGEPAKLKETLQRLAIRQKREDNPELVKTLESLPATALNEQQKKRLPDFLTPEMITCVFEFLSLK